MKPSATPISNGERLNKWCARECERSTIFDDGEPIVIEDLEHPLPNCHWRRAT